MLRVRILGRGGAYRKHLAAYNELPALYKVVENGPCDIIDICTPNYLHFPQARDALENGCHAIVEKPVCGSLHEVDTLLNLSSKTGKRVYPIFQYRSSPQPFTTWHLKRDPGYWAGWRGKWETALGGCLTSHGIHLFDAFVRAFGMPGNVFVYYHGNAQGHGIEKHVQLQLWSGGLRLRAEICLNAYGSLPRAGNSHIGYVNQLRLIHDAIVYNGPPPVTLHDARKSLEILTAAYYSVYTQETAHLPITDGHPFYHGWTEAMKEWSERPEHTSGSSPKTAG